MDYAVYDVFTDEPFGGNPLAVVFQADALSTEDMQKIAREFNFSETTFVLPPDDPEHSAKVRIFTPGMELAFAGHPIVGTALALADRDRLGPNLVLEIGVGPIAVTLSEQRASFVTNVALKLGEAPDVNQLAACLSLPKDAIRTDRHNPVTAGLGTDFTLVELRDEIALGQASANVEAFRAAAGLDASRLAIFIYCRDGQQIDARMFQPLGGIPEDPATGSAAAALVSYLGQKDGQSGEFEITQGVTMGRPSKISAKVTVDNRKSSAVEISGSAVKVMEGKLSLGAGLA